MGSSCTFKCRRNEVEAEYLLTIEPINLPTYCSFMVKVYDEKLITKI